MIQKAIAIVFLVVMSISCTKTNPNTVQTKSPLHFIYDKTLQGTDVVAQLGEDKISYSQLLSPSPALTELEDRVNEIVLRKVYTQAEKVTQITFGFLEPKEGLKKVLGKDFKQEIQVVFDPMLVGGIAKLNDKMLSLDELSKDDTLLSRLMTSRFEQSIKALEGLFARRKILEASQASKITMEEYIKDKVLGAPLTASDADVDAFAKKNNLTEAEVNEALRKQIKDTIISNNREQKINEYVAKNLISDPIRIAFTEPTMVVDVPNVDETAPHLGQGPIRVLLFSRWDCANCKTSAVALSEFVASYEKYFKINYLFNFPANSNEERMVAEASLCVQKQNAKYFWNFVKEFDPKSNENIEEAVNQAVKNSGSDFETFRTCFLARDFKDQVDAHIQATQGFGFYKTPVVVLDGKVMEVPDIKDFVEKALAIKAEKGLGFNLFYRIQRFFKK